MKHVTLKYMFVQEVVEKKHMTLACVNTSSNKAHLMTKCHTFEAHVKRCAMLGLKLSRDGDLSVSCLCENGVETHLAKESFLRFGNEHEPLIRKSGVYFVKAQTVNA